jgi:hypothetical protein
MKFNYFIPMLSLQLFAEGGAGAGDGGTAEGAGATEVAAVPQTKGEKNNPLASVKYGIQEDTAPAAEGQAPTVEQPDRNAEFEKLIKGEYKDLYDAKMQDTIQRRLKGSKETVDKFNALTPTLEMLAQKYGVDAGDIEALNKAIQEDDSYYEQEALEKGVTVQQLKEIRRMERENAALRQQMQEQESRENANRLYAQWMQQEQETKAVYPSFSLEAEMQNPQFVNLLRSNVDVRTAYEVLHKDDIIRGAMQFTAQTVEQKIANKIKANGARPTEGGMGSQSAAVVKSDVSQLSKADRAEIIRRVQRGEKISF